MTALWTSSHGFSHDWGSGDSWSNGDGGGNDSWSDGWGDGWSGRGNGDGAGSENGSGGGYGCSDGSDGSDDYGLGNRFGFPEQDYDGCTAIGRLRIEEAKLPVADLLTLAVAR